jgi:holo-[acyl-carrier protein] synthase
LIIGIGTDIVGVERMRDSLSRLGDKFAKRILSDGEFTEFSQSSQQAAFLAKRFAAKEAAAKAFGTGFRDGLSLRHISVGHDELGKPLLLLSDKAEQLAENKAVGETHLSLADEQDYAVAYVIMEKK